MSAEQTWRVEVVYATPTRQVVIEASVRPGVTVEQVIRASGMLAKFPEIDLTRQRVGIFGVIAHLQDAVHDGDRVEIYRSLVADPKEARRARAGSRSSTKK
jgi:putative ubiquitin-RnfH superfamily antitoxin RatB of RatAB toxin-antitoxin module